jgi:hydrogenase nickel incorporation protein HypA/HybF
VHELALAEAVIATALDVARDEGISAISRLTVRVGELQQIERETFEFALREIVPASEPRIASAAIAVETEPARLRCRPCGHEFGLDAATGPGSDDESEAIHFIPELAHGFLRCPRCHSPDFEVLEGRGVAIARIEGE